MGYKWATNHSNWQQKLTTLNNTGRTETITSINVHCTFTTMNNYTITGNCNKLKGKGNYRAVHGTPSHSYGVSLAI